MWIFLNDAFMSAVQHRGNPNLLMIRSRFRDDLQRVFPQAEMTETPNADYRFRVVVSRADLQGAMIKEVDRINYDNFKGSIGKDEHFRHDAYMGVWSVMNRAQQLRHGNRPQLYQLPVFEPKFYDDEPG